MIRKLHVLPLMAVLGVAACASGGDGEEAHEAETPPIAQADIIAADGSNIGHARLEADGQSWRLLVDVAGLPEGAKGIHLHEAGQCEGPEFASAGGHLNPHGRKHGLNNPEGSHLGDLPNLDVDSDGKASASVILQGSAQELESALFDENGTAIVIHAGPDDMITDPAGDSGARIACGVLKRG